MIVEVPDQPRAARYQRTENVGLDAVRMHDVRTEGGEHARHPPDESGQCRRGRQERGDESEARSVRVPERHYRVGRRYDLDPGPEGARGIGQRAGLERHERHLDVAGGAAGGQAVEEHPFGSAEPSGRAQKGDVHRGLPGGANSAQAVNRHVERLTACDRSAGRGYRPAPADT